VASGSRSCAVLGASVRGRCLPNCGMCYSRVRASTSLSISESRSISELALDLAAPTIDARARPAIPRARGRSLSGWVVETFRGRRRSSVCRASKGRRQLHHNGPDEGEARAHQARKAPRGEGPQRTESKRTRRRRARRAGGSARSSSAPARRSTSSPSRRAGVAPCPGAASWGLDPKTAIWGRNRRNPPGSSRIGSAASTGLIRVKPAW
jgi:hypothetical protein